MANTSLMEYLNGIAAAVQAKTGSTKKIKLKDIASEIAKIDTFGSHEFLDPITVTTNGIIDVTNYSSINVNVADVDDLAVYFANDGVEDTSGDRHYSIVYKDYNTEYNEETQQYETIGYTSEQFIPGEYNFACLQYNSSNSIHNETIYFDQLGSDEIIIQNRNLSGETVTELEVVRLADGAYNSSTHLAYYNTYSGYVNVYEGYISSGDIFTFTGNGISTISDTMPTGSGLINDGDGTVQFNLGTNNIMYRLSNSTIYNDALHNYEVTYYDKTETNTYKIKTRDLSEYDTRVLFYNQNQYDGNGNTYQNNEKNTVLFKDLQGDEYNLNSAIYPSNGTLQVGNVGYRSSGNGESYILAEWSSGGIGIGHIDSTTIAYLDSSNAGLSTIELRGSDGNYIVYADDSNSSIESIEFPDYRSIFYYNSSNVPSVSSLQDNIAYTDGSNVYVQGFTSHKNIFYYNSSGEASVSSLQDNIAYLQGSTVYTQGFDSDYDIFYYNSSNEPTVSSLDDSIAYSDGSGVYVEGFTNTSVAFYGPGSTGFMVSTLGTYDVIHQSISSGLDVTSMNSTSVGYFNNGEFRVVDFDGSGTNGYIAYYNGSSISVEYMSNYTRNWSYNSSSQKVYGMICVDGFLVDITEDMLKALVDAGAITPAGV